MRKHHTFGEVHGGRYHVSSPYQLASQRGAGRMRRPRCLSAEQRALCRQRQSHHRPSHLRQSHRDQNGVGCQCAFSLFAISRLLSRHGFYFDELTNSCILQAYQTTDGVRKHCRKCHPEWLSLREKERVQQQQAMGQRRRLAPLGGKVSLYCVCTDEQADRLQMASGHESEPWGR